MTTPVDQAFKRYLILSTLIEWEQERARTNPQDMRYLNLGITSAGDTKQDATQKTVEAFDDLLRLIEHVAILDMTGSFEAFLRGEIATTADLIKTLIEGGVQNDKKRSFSERLVRTADDFKGLQYILRSVEGELPQKVRKAIQLVRESRNKFAHGTDLQNRPAIEPEQARDSLNQIISCL